VGADCSRPLIDLGGRVDGAQSVDGRVSGTYVHGLFASDGFRGAFLRALGGQGSAARYEEGVEVALDRLADHLERHVEIGQLLEIAGLHKKNSEPTKAAKKTSAQAPV
jgi:adenosylcobyric acid synthase